MEKLVNPVPDNPSTTLAGYQQALDDFGIIQLLQKLILVAPAQVEVEERESLAAYLIEQLAASLNSSLIDQFLNAIARGDGGAISDAIAIELNALPTDVTLAEVFPYNYASGCFAIGDRVEWKPLPDPSDWGTVIGRFWAYAPHRRCWGWKYVIWLDQGSPSSAWIVADTAWEQDLQPEKAKVKIQK